MAHRAPADVVLADLVDAQRRHHPGIVPRLERVLQGERIHHGGEHAHVIGGDPVHAGAREAGAAEDVAAAEHHGHLHAQLGQVADLAGDALEHAGIDAVILVAEQRLAGQFDEDSSVGGGRRCVGHDLVPYYKRPRRGGVFRFSAMGVSADAGWLSPEPSPRRRNHPVSSRCRPRPHNARTRTTLAPDFFRSFSTVISGSLTKG